MTVQQLINELTKVKDKSKQVGYQVTTWYDNDEYTECDDRIYLIKEVDEELYNNIVILGES